MVGRFAVIIVALLSLAACGSSPAGGRTTPAPTHPPSQEATPEPVPTASPSPGHATAREAADAGAHATGQVTCASYYPGRQTLLTDAVGVFVYAGGPCGPGGHHVEFVWVYRDAGGWHPYTWAGTQAARMPANDGWGADIPMETGGGCVNVRAAPSTTAAVASCVGSSVTVIPASSDHQPWNPPVVADGFIWWYVFTLTPGTGPGPDSEGTPLGWVVLDYLVCGSGPRSLNESCPG